MATPTQTAPRRGISEPPSLYRQPLRIWSAGDFAGDQWRFLVGQAPIVRSCVTTIVMYLNSMDWFLEGDDQDAVAYYTTLLETADEGAGWSVYAARLIDDCCTMPMGGIAEMGVGSDKTVAWTAHLDAATVRPTGLTDFPYGQIDPWGAREPVPFSEAQIGRVRWMPETRLKMYEYTKTPAGDAVPAITALVRADRFWQSQLLDTPPAGILDLMDMTEQEATDWYESWKQLLSGQDAFKVPVLYGGQDRKQPAAFIPFTATPQALSMTEVVRQYIQQVTACFGLTTGDLGIDVQNLRLAGATKLVDLTKRQGPGNVAKGLKSMIDNDILPDGVTFQWREIDSEDSLRKGQGRLQSATALATAVQAGFVPERLAQLAAEHLGIIPQEAIDEYNAELEGQGPAIEDAPEDSTPTGDEAQRAMPPRSKWSKRMKVVADKLLAPSRQGFTRARIKGLIETGLSAYGTTRSAPEVVRQGGGCIVALVPALDAGARLAIAGGESPSEMHITIAYLDADADRTLLQKVVEGFAAISPALSGEAGGVGRFVGPEGEDAVYASVDLPGLPAWRQRLIEMIVASGLAVNKTHGFSPHITLQFVPSEVAVMLPAFEPVPLAFTDVWIWDGDTRASYPLNPDAVALSYDVVTRTRESAEAALLKKLSKETWWKSPRLVDDVFTILTGAYEDGIAEAIRSVGGKVKTATVNLTNKAVLGELEAHAGEFITQIDDGTRNMIVKHVMAGVERGLSSPDIADAIVSDVRSTLLETWKGRVDSIVNFEINRAETHATLREYQEIGLEEKQWHAIPGLACDLCLSNDDLGLVPMDYQFETVFGGADGPPGHPRVCHCRVSFSKSELKKLGESPEFWLGD